MAALSTPSSKKSSSAATSADAVALDLFASTAPLGYVAGDANLYRYVENNPTQFTDPTGEERVYSGVDICQGYQKGDLLFSWFGVHGFIKIDGKGFGFFEVNGNAVGTGKVRDDDLVNYPEMDPEKAKEDQWYSVCKPVYIDDECFDPVKFRQAIRDFITERKNDPGNYIAGIRDCDAFVLEATIHARNESRKGWFCPSGIADVFDKLFSTDF